MNGQLERVIIAQLARPSLDTTKRRLIVCAVHAAAAVSARQAAAMLGHLDYSSDKVVRPADNWVGRAACNDCQAAADQVHVCVRPMRRM